MSRALCVMLAFLLIPIVGQAQEGRIKVSLDVSADEFVKPQILSYMRNALRSIRDVEVVDKSYDYKLQVAVTYSAIRYNTKLYSLSYIVLQSVPPNVIKSTFKSTLSNISLRESIINNEIYKIILKKIEEDTSLEKFSSYLSIARSQFIHSNYILKDICESAVAAFDNSVLEEERNNAKILKELLEQQHISWAQTELNTFGFYDGPIDGTMGPKTRDALRKYQRSKGFPATGEIDKLTRDGFDSDRERRSNEQDEQLIKKWEERRKQQKP